MHMADALISPAVGAAGWAVALAVGTHAARRVERTAEPGRPALMGVLGAFVFAAQMVNFSIPGTGSSGHLGGGLLLSALLGPHAAFLVMASVLTVQALLFADGGLLALGCNVVNLGFFTCYLAYPLLFLKLAGREPGRARLLFSSLVAAVVGLELGALAVVLETTASGISELPFRTFLLFMLPIHCAIGVVEGLITGGVLLYVWQARPDLVRLRHTAPQANRPLRPLLVAFGLAATLVGGLLSWFASTHPDGLEWSAARVSGHEELPPRENTIGAWLGRLQKATSLLPDYSFGSSAEDRQESQPGWPAPDAGTSVSGLVGGLITLLLALVVGLGLRSLRTRAKEDSPPAR